MFDYLLIEGLDILNYLKAGIKISEFDSKTNYLLIYNTLQIFISLIFIKYDNKLNYKAKDKNFKNKYFYFYLAFTNTFALFFTYINDNYNANFIQINFIFEIIIKLLLFLSFINILKTKLNQ